MNKLKRMPFLVSKSVLLKFIISFMIVFLLPLLVLGIVVYQDSYVKVKQTLEQSALNNLEQLRNYGDSRLREISYTTERIRHDYTLQHYSILEGADSQLRTIDRLNLYKGDNSNMQELLLYLHEQELIFTSRGIVRLPVMAASAFPTSPEQQEQFIRMMKQTHSAYVRPAGPVNTNDGTSADVMMFLFPIPDNVDNPRESLVFFIPNSGFEKMIQGLLNQTGGWGGIWDPAGKRIAGFGDNPFTDQELHAAVQTASDRTITSIRLKGDRFTFIQTRSDRNSWTYWALLPEQSFYRPVVSKQIGLAVTGLAIVVFGSLLIVMLSFMHYRPVNQFLQAIRTHFPETRSARTVPEWTEIKENLHALETRKTVTRHQIIENLLQGREAYDPKRHYVASGLLLDDPWAAVALFRIERADVPLNSVEIQELLHKLETQLTSQDVRCYFAGMEQLNDCAILLNGREPDNDLIGGKIEWIQRSLAESGLKGTFGIGTWQPVEEGIRRSFVEATAALDYGWANKGTESIVVFSEMKAFSMPDMEWFPVKEQLRYLQSLKQGDAEEAAACLQEIMSTVRRHASSFLLSKYVCLHFITEVIKTIQQEKLDYNPEDLHHLLQFTNVASLETMLEELTETICRDVVMRKSRQHSALAIQVVDFLQQQFARPDFSLDLAADHFRISPSHVSRLVKGQTDKTFAQYLSDLRMNEAKRLLTETNLPINDIVVKIGYIDPKNFMRKFKNETGMTLGDYRKLHKHTE